MAAVASRIVAAVIKARGNPRPESLRSWHRACRGWVAGEDPGPGGRLHFGDPGQGPGPLPSGAAEALARVPAAAPGHRARVLAPSLATGWLVEVKPLAPAASWAAAAGHAALLPHASTLPGPAAATAAAAAHRAGISLLTWTVDDPAEAARLAAAGLDGIITNRPDAVRSALGEHHDHHGG